jgi:hypothetical protein
MSIFQLYLLAILPGVANVLCTFSVLFGSILGVFSIASSLDLTDPLPYSFKFGVVLGGLLIVSVLIPSRSDLAFIIGGHYATHSAEAQKLPDNILKAMNAFLQGIQKEKNDTADTP